MKLGLLVAKKNVDIQTNIQDTCFTSIDLYSKRLKSNMKCLFRLCDVAGLVASSGGSLYRMVLWQPRPDDDKVFVSYIHVLQINVVNVFLYLKNIYETP